MIVTMPVIVEMVTFGNNFYHLYVQSLIFFSLFQLILYNNINLINISMLCRSVNEYIDTDVMQTSKGIIQFKVHVISEFIAFLFRNSEE
jgi:hypothetical protein